MVCLEQQLVQTEQTVFFVAAIIQCKCTHPSRTTEADYADRHTPMTCFQDLAKANRVFGTAS